jgi:hypothetical protein
MLLAELLHEISDGNAPSLVHAPTDQKERDGIIACVYGGHGDRRNVLTLSHWRVSLVCRRGVMVSPREVAGDYGDIHTDLTQVCYAGLCV